MPDPQKLETPASAKTAPNEPRIFTMPEKYRGMAATQKPPQPSPPPVPVPAPAVPKPPVPSPAKPGGPVAKKKLSKTTRALLIGGGILLVGLVGVGIYVFLATRPVQAPTPEAVETEPATPVEEVEEAPAEEEEAPAEEEETEKPVSPFETELTPGRDTDSDGLTDLEEAFYGTNARLPDTDADGFLDGNEVFHRYNPRGTAPGTLLESGLAKEYGRAASYRVLYPSAWSVKAVEGQTDGVVFMAPSAETVTIAVEAKSDAAMSLSDWYAAANPESEEDPLSGTTKNSYPMLMAENQMTVFVDLGASVMTLVYQVQVKATIDYLQTFQRMVNSVSAVTP